MSESGLSEDREFSKAKAEEVVKYFEENMFAFMKNNSLQFEFGKHLQKVVTRPKTRAGGDVHSEEQVLVFAVSKPSAANITLSLNFKSQVLRIAFENAQRNFKMDIKAYEEMVEEIDVVRYYLSKFLEIISSEHNNEKNVEKLIEVAVQRVISKYKEKLKYEDNKLIYADGDTHIKVEIQRKDKIITF